MRSVELHLSELQPLKRNHCILKVFQEPWPIVFSRHTPYQSAVGLEGLILKSSGFKINSLGLRFGFGL